MMATRTRREGGVPDRGHVFFSVLAVVAIGTASAATITAPRAVATAAAQPVPLRSLVVSLTLEAHARQGEMAAQSAAYHKSAKVGDEFEGGLQAGTPATRDVCDARATPYEETYVSWKVRAKVRGADSERIEIELAWTRTTAGSDARQGGSGTITLRPGRSHLIDVLAPGPSESGSCSHVTLRLTADRSFPSSDSLLVHRIWLVHERGGSRSVSDPIEAVGPVGERVRFRFRPLDWNMAGTMVRTPQAPGVDLDVMGTVASEPLEDGGVETVLDVRRDARVGPVSYRGSGTMVMTTRLGEADEIEVPQPGGGGLIQIPNAPAGPLARGFTRKGERIAVDFGEFFKGSRTSLVVMVERLR